MMFITLLLLALAVGTYLFFRYYPPFGGTTKRSLEEQSRQMSADRAQRRNRSDVASPHNDELKSNRNPKRR